ncbi:MAG: hypothetical protein E5W44_11140 [Mesorhizobium sp.]|nr:MAG: hypothetical protein E5W44_11140 [Mesorhizobium sp.]
MTRVTLGKSRVREIRPPGSVRAKAEWLSYSTTTAGSVPQPATKLLQHTLQIVSQNICDCRSLTNGTFTARSEVWYR